jgi:hypothetical protein
MRKAYLLLVLLLCLPLASCLPGRGRERNSAPQPYAQLAGVWEDPETQDRHTIRWVRGRFTVTSVESSGGERYTVDRATWANGVLVWRFRVPGTQYAVTLSTIGAGPRTLDVHWSDTDGTSRALTLNRVSR